MVTSTPSGGHLGGGLAETKARVIVAIATAHNTEKVIKQSYLMLHSLTYY